MKRANLVAVLLCVVAGAMLQTENVLAQDSAAAASAWRQLLEQDVQHLAKIIPTYYIYAVHPGGPEWDAQLHRSLELARRDAALVKDLGSYRAALQHFVVSFDDAHFSAYFNVTMRRARWPRFSLEYQGGDYVIVNSLLASVKINERVASCDGKGMNQWMDELAQFYGGPPGLETTRAAIARQLFVDFGNPLYPLPRNCRIAERDVALEWVKYPEDMPLPDVRRTSFSAPTVTDTAIDVSDLSKNAAWVRIGTMMPSTEQEAAQFRRVIDAAPQLRDKDVVVIDVRGNAGGMYNWFMAFLRAFYGQPYADYYARARLEIANTILVVSPTGTDDPGFTADFNQIEVPPDPPMAVSPGKPLVKMLPSGSRLIFNRPPVEAISYPKKPPARLVHAKVYLLTDYGCGSACLSFVDEMMRFPGVVQIGAETHIDRRSGGWPAALELPSGLAFVRAGRMVREGRRRGENEAWVPKYRFPGNIADTAAVKKWIVDEVVTRDRGRD